MQLTEADYGDLNIRVLEIDGITWVNVVSPTDAELEWLESKYGCHPMTLQSGPSHGEMSTIDDYDTYLFLETALHKDHVFPAEAGIQ